VSHEKIGQGFDHIVFRTERNWVLKIPYGFNLLVTSLNPGARVEFLHQELRKAIELSAQTQIYVPKTRIFAINRSYVIAQEYLTHDSDKKIEDVLAEVDPKYLAFYDDKPANFVHSQDRLYTVDPFSSLASRLAEKYHLLTYEHYKQLVHLYRSMKKSLSAR
jgi:hypothetical protein